MNLTEDENIFPPPKLISIVFYLMRLFQGDVKKLKISSCIFCMLTIFSKAFTVIDSKVFYFSIILLLTNPLLRATI
ncbi:MAG: hypothetical protein ACD_34C00489G0001 [uncultured bacterium]|nr:MAG: hypothetical protein ACD_34C00489G0001 [uncultured bacterium]